MDTQLRDRVVLVTGASSGIGKAIAVAFAREGARVALTYASDRAAAERAAAQVDGAGGQALVVPLDLNVMKEASFGGTLRRVIEGASSKEARLHVARWIGSQSPPAGLLPAR